MFRQVGTALRFFSFVTLVTFFPSCVGVWNFVPERLFVAQAEETPPGDTAKATLVTPNPLPRMSEDELKAATGGPGQLAKRNESPQEVDRRVRVAKAGLALPTAEVLLGSIPKPGATKEKADVSPTKVAQLDGVGREVRGPLGPQEAAAALTHADGLKSGGEFSEAMTAYFEIMDRYPDTNEALWADQGMWDVINGLADGTLPRQVVTAFESSLSSWQPQTVEGAYARLTYYGERAMSEMRAGNAVSQREYATASKNTAWDLVVASPNHYLSLSAINYFYESAQLLGREVEDPAMEQLKAYATDLGPCQARLGAWYALGTHYERVDVNDRGSAGVAWTNVIAESKKPYVSEMMNQQLPFWVKGFMGEYVGRALSQTGKYAEAKEWYDIGVQQCTHVGPTHYYLALRSAQMTELMNPMDPSAGTQAFQDYLSKYPDSNWADRAMLEMGAVYMLASDYRGAADIFRELIQRYPEGKVAKVAEGELNYIMENLYDSIPALAAKTPPQTEEQIKTAQVCGPNALHRLLADQGVKTSVDELATLAGTDDEGTTMLGLVKAADAKGVKLLGVSANNIGELALPAIAFVNHHHFIVVNKVASDAVIVWDEQGGEQPLTKAEFSAMWDGQALVSTNVAQQTMTVAALEKSKGGDVGIPAASANAQPKSMYIGFNGGAGFAAVDPSAVAKGAHWATAISSPGINAEIDDYETCLDIREKDVSLCARGPLSLFFGRVYINEKGYPRTGSLTHMGTGWTNTLAIYLTLGELSDPVDATSNPVSISFQDSTGTARLYDYDSDNGTYYVYKRNTTGQTDEKGITIRYTATNTSSNRKSYIDFPNGMQYEFASAGSSPGGKTVRLNYIRDANSANTMNFAYDSTSLNALLTKVQSPVGDTHNIQISYDGTSTSSKITKVELKETSTVLQTVTYAYDASSRLTKVTDNEGKTIKYAYQGQGGTSQTITKVTDKANIDTNLAWYFQDDAGGAWQAYKIEVTPPSGLKQVYDRSVSTNINTMTPKDGGGTALGKEVATPLTGDASRTRYEDTYKDGSNYDRYGYEYNTSSDLTKSVRPDNNTQATFSYTTTGRMSTLGDTDGTITADYDYATSTDLQPTKVTNAAGLAAGFNYTSANQLTKITPPELGASGITASFDAYGQITSATNPSGQPKTLNYDMNGNITSVKDALNNETKYEYDQNNNMTKTIDPRNKTIYYYYAGDGSGGGSSLTKIKDPLNNETVFLYDSNGNETRITDALGRSIDYFYDSANRMTRTESPSGSGAIATYSFDLEGQLTQETDFEGKSANYFYDFMGQETKQSDGAGTCVEYTYDWWEGNLSTVKDGNGNVTDYDYDLDGFLTKVNYADGKVTRYFYDEDGRQTKVGAGSTGTTDVTEQFYSPITGKVTKAGYCAGAGTVYAAYAYNTNGQLTKLTDWLDGTNGLRYAYDASGKLTQLTDYDNSTLTYVYDAAGNILSMTDYHGSLVTYTYTDRNELSTITAPGSKVWDYDYNALGQVTKCFIPNGMTTEYSYDNRNRLTKIEHKDGGTVDDGFTYAMDKQGNITRTTHQDNSYWDYWYDLRDRLTKAERKNSAGTLIKRWSYDYSLANNMTMKQIYDGTNTQTSVYTYTQGNELTKQTEAGVDTNFAYDAWGRLTSKTSAGTTASYYWNYGDKLTRLTSNFSGEGTVDYDYGGDGKRRERYSGGVTTWYNYDKGWGVLNEEDGSNNLTETYVQDPSRPIGTILADLAGSAPSSSPARYYFRDHTGSTRRLRDASKASIGSYEYEPYGDSYASSGASIVNRFGGHDWDDTGKLYYAPYRHYSPSLSRWISRDPLGFVDGPNVYSMVCDNPILNLDADGRFMSVAVEFTLNAEVAAQLIAFLASLNPVTIILVITVIVVVSLWWLNMSHSDRKATAKAILAAVLAGLGSRGTGHKKNPEPGKKNNHENKEGSKRNQMLRKIEKFLEDNWSPSKIYRNIVRKEPPNEPPFKVETVEIEQIEQVE